MIALRLFEMIGILYEIKVVQTELCRYSVYTTILTLSVNINTDGSTGMHLRYLWTL